MRCLVPLAGVLVVAGVAAVLAFGQPARPSAAAADKPPHTITVTGSGTASAKPDTVRVHLTVTSSAREVTEARARTVAAVKKVQAAIAALNLPDPKTRTTDTNVTQREDKTDANRRPIYDVSVGFTVRLASADPEKLAGMAEQVLDAGLSNGVNAQGRVEFFLADDTALKREAIQKAVEDALASAKAAAAGAKVTVAEVASIDESPSPWYGGGRGFNNNLQQVAPAGGDGTLAAGNWTVTSSVRVVCRY